MNKLIVIAAITALSATISLASEEGGAKFGVRAGFNLIDPSSGNKEEDKYINMGTGFGAGLVAAIPISGPLAIRAGIEFHYRTIYEFSFNEDPYLLESTLTELALNIPAMIQYGFGDAWAGVGVQVDIPFSTENEYSEKWGSIASSGTVKVKNRNSMDFGIAIGAGYNATPQIGIDLKCIIGMTSLSGESGDKSSYKQYGIGAAYFF